MLAIAVAIVVMEVLSTLPDPLLRPGIRGLSVWDEKALRLATRDLGLVTATLLWLPTSKRMSDHVLLEP